MGLKCLEASSNRAVRTGVVEASCVEFSICVDPWLGSKITVTDVMNTVFTSTLETHVN